MKKLITGILIIVMVLSITACQTTSVDTKGSTESKPTSSPEGQKEPVEVPELTYWVELNANMAQVVTEMGETEYAKELQERTGVKIKYQHPAAGQSTEAFNILIASADYPDIIEYTWTNYPGGPVAAIDNNVIIELNDTFKNHSPNLFALLEQYPNVGNIIRTDAGQYYCYPFLRGTSTENNPLLFSEGFVIRKDWLDKVGLDVPETAEEWYTALVAFRDELNVEIPFTVRGKDDHLTRVLAPGFDSWHEFVVEDGVVKNPVIDETRLAYLTEAKKWYDEGILDSEFLAVDKKTQASKILNEQAGATWAPGGSGIGTWLPALRETDPNVDFVSAPPMYPEKGRVSKYSKINQLYGSGAAISTACTNIEAAARLLDYAYGEEGHMLNNFGIEGVTYEMVDGYPKYTDEIMNNPDGLNIMQAMSKYIRGHISGPLVQDYRELEQYYELPQLQEALQLWTKTDTGKYLMPPVSPTSEESEELAQIMNNVNIYRREMESKFITGVEPLSKFDEYVEQMKAFELERAVEIMQNSYDRFMAR